MNSRLSILEHLRRSTFLMEAMAMLVMLMVLVKGFIPAGYMPDMGALQNGIIKITICTASGFEQKVIDEQGTPASKHQAGADFCPFGWSPHAVATPLALFFIPNQFSAPEHLLAFKELFLSKPYHALASPRAPPVHI